MRFHGWGGLGCLVANRQALAYVYFEGEPGRRAAAKLLTPMRDRRRNRQSAGAVECPWNLEQRAPGFGDGLRRLPALTNRSRGVRRTQFPFGIRSFNNFRFLGRNPTASY